MPYVYAEVDPAKLNPAQVEDAERVLDAARHELGLIGRGIAYCIRWYVRSERVAEYPLTRHGRALDVPDDRHLSGWYLDPRGSPSAPIGRDGTGISPSATRRTTPGRKPTTSP